MLKPASLQKILSRLDRLPRENIEKALQEAEKEQGALCNSLDRIPEGVVILEGDKPLFLNQYALNFFQISESSSRGTSLTTLIENKEISEWVKNSIINADQGFRGQLHFVDNKALIVSLESGSRSKAPRFFTFVDITNNLDEVEEMFRNERIESISQLASAVAHEIKNPLHSLQLHMHILKQEIEKAPELAGSQKGKIDKSLSVILDETKRLNDLTNNFSKLGSLKDHYRSPADINGLIESVLGVIHPELKSFGISLSTTFDSRLPKIPVQKEKIYQTILNLLKNAIESRSKKNGEISIKTSLVGNCCQIEIHDNGAGISEENLERIFEPYFSTKKEGSGLGLVMVKETIEDHGGSIRVESGKKGTIFTLYLPIKQAPLKLPKEKK